MPSLDVRRRLLVGLLLGLVWLTGGCRPAATGLGEQPPRVDETTPRLQVFDPLGEAGPGAGASGPAAVAGPPSPPEPAPLPAPAVVDYGPTAEASNFPTIQVRFNRAMVPLGERERMSPADIGLRITPALAGEVYWAEPTRLVFEPRDELPLATEYQVALHQRFAAIDGPAIDVDLRWSFATAGPQPSLWTDHDAAMSGRESYHWQARVAVEVDQELSLAELRKHVRAQARTEAGELVPVPVRVSAVPRDRDGYRYPEFWIVPERRWPADSEIVVTVAKQLRGKAGPRPVGYDTVHSFRTAPGVEVLGRDCIEGEYDDGCELGPVALAFNAPLRRSQVRQIRISPEPRHFDVLAIDREEDERGRPLDSYWKLLMWGEFERDRDYTITVGDAVRDVHGQALVGERSFELRFVEPPPSLALERARGTFPSENPAKLGIESRHVETLGVRVAVLDDARHEQLLFAEHDRGLAWPSGLAPIHDLQVQPSHAGAFGWSSHELDLQALTRGKPAALLIEARADTLLARAQGRPVPRAQAGLVQLSDLGLTAVGSLGGGVVRVARLRDDSPVAGATIELITGPGQRRSLGETDREGLLRLPGATEIGERALIRARLGDDQIVVSIAQLHRRDASAGSLRTGESVRATVMTERPLYKPGERIRVLGWTSIATPYELSGLRPIPANTKVAIVVRDFRDEVVARTTVTAKDHGKFWATLKLPETAALGHYSATATVLDQTFTTSLQVKDFPVPAFEVSATADKTDVHAGEATRIQVSASYYFGGRVPLTRVRTSDECRDIDYRPPGLDPNVSVAPRREPWRGYGGLGRAVLQRPTGPHAHDGRVDYELQLWTGHEYQTTQCTHSVAVADRSEQDIGAEATIWVHPDFYLAVEAPRLAHEGEDASVTIRTIDFDGSPVPVDEVEVTLHRRWSEPEYVTEDGEQRIIGWREREQTLPRCTVRSEGATACEFRKLAHGSYAITVVAVPGGDYKPRVRASLWVSRTPAQQVHATPPPRLRVELDQTKPVPGQRIRATVRTPWKTGTGLLLLAKGGLHQVHGFTLDRGQATIELEVSDAWIPGATVHALAVRPGDANSLPAVQTDKVALDIADDARRLAVSVRVPAEAQTRAKLPIEIEVRDALGRPVAGHVSVWAVDEAVLSLAPLVLPDFVEAFVVGFSGALELISGYPALLLPFVTRSDPYDPRVFDPGWLRDALSFGYGHGSGSGYGAGGSGSGFGGRGSAGAGLPQARNKFDSAPIFLADVELGDDGRARVVGELPDNLTTFRITAVASATLADSRASQSKSKSKSKSKAKAKVEARFGTGDARVRVTQPLVVRAAMPRVMRPGDLAEIGVLVDNLRGGAGTVDLAFTVHHADGADGVLELLDTPTRTLDIAAGGQQRVPFRVRARTTGTPEIEVSAVMRSRTGGSSPERIGGQAIADALRLPLPIEAERTQTERVAVYGSLAEDGAALLPFVLPRDADPEFGGLSVSVGSTLLGGLEDAVAYLVRYPYGCVEQTSSSLLPLIALGRLAPDYPLGIADVDDYVAVGIARLRAMQLPSGGFSYWPGGIEPARYASGYATWVLGQAAAAGYPVPPAMLEAADAYLLGVVAAWQQRPGPSVGEDIELALILASLAERDKAPAAAIDALYARRQRLPVFAQALVLIAVHATAPRSDARIAELQRELLSLVDEREAIAKVELQQRYTWYWDSPTRSSALVLIALLHTAPEHPLAAKLTRGLLDARRGGRWANTQENAYALVALADYAAAYESEHPRFDGRVWLGNQALATVHVDGREFGFTDAFTPMAKLAVAAQQADDRLILERAGQGRMYYRVGLEWASSATDKPAKAEGIRVTRLLRAETGIVAADAVIATGSLLAIDLELEVHSALDHIAVEIPLPAGLEAVDVELGKGTKAMMLAGHRGAWVSHQELHRDRALVFADHLEPGRHQTTVFLRATTPGDYVMPAAAAEQMYYPEVYGRTTARRLLVR
jgi:alpha-2-macroglobulin